MKISFWIKAFIPGQLPKITYRVKINEENSISALPLQSYFPFWTSFYATDDRDFSNLREASARITTIIEIPNINDSYVTFLRYSNPTLQLRKPWKMLFFNSGDKKDFKLESLISVPGGKQSVVRTKNIFNISFTTYGSNPFFNFAGINYAAPIQMKFNLIIEPKDTGDIDISFAGETSQFPAFEAYIQINDKDPISLYRSGPEKGKTPFDLIYGATKKVDIKTTLTSYKHKLFVPKSICSHPVVEAESHHSIKSKL